MKKLIKLLFGLLVLVFVLFSGRDWLGWLPQNKIKKRIAAAELSWNEHNFCLLQCYGFSNASLVEMAQDSDVLFKESQKDTDPKEYQLQHIENGVTTRLRFKFEPIGPDDLKPKVEVVGVEQTGSSKTCDCP